MLFTIYQYHLKWSSFEQPVDREKHLQGLLLYDGEGRITYSRNLEPDIALEGIALARQYGERQPRVQVQESQACDAVHAGRTPFTRPLMQTNNPHTHHHPLFAHHIVS